MKEPDYTDRSTPANMCAKAVLYISHRANMTYRRICRSYKFRNIPGVCYIKNVIWGGELLRSPTKSYCTSSPTSLREIDTQVAGPNVIPWYILTWDVVEFGRKYKLGIIYCTIRYLSLSLYIYICPETCRSWTENLVSDPSDVYKLLHIGQIIDFHWMI